jgi:two-component system, sensor histidine kinase and response regulator
MKALASPIRAPVAPPPLPRAFDQGMQAATTAGLHILLAEDHPVNQKVAVRMLERLGHSVVVAPDGRAALDALLAHSFDLVLMDVQMPEMDGCEAVRIIRERELRTHAHLPVLALTAHAMQGDRERCLEAGFDGYLSKPVRQAELQEALAALELRAAGGRVRDQEILDGLNEVCGGDEDFARELAESFLESAPRCVVGIDRAVQSCDSRELASQAHALKGISSTIGCHDLAAVSAEMEQAARRGDLHTAVTIADRLKPTWQRARSALEHLMLTGVAR